MSPFDSEVYVPGSPGSGASLGSEEREGLTLRSLRSSVGEVGGEDVMLLAAAVFPAPLVDGGASLKICTVSVAELTHSNVDAALKLMQ